MTVVTTDGMAHGGDAIGRIDGKAVFVGGALPGERVEVVDLIDRGSYAKARLAEVLDPAPERIDPPCPVFAECGGCQWQHAAIDAQLDYKRSVVAGQLEHLGRVSDPPVMPTVSPGPPFRYRNKMSFYVQDGRPGQYRARSHTVVPADDCLLLVDELRDLYGRLPRLDGVSKITLRQGTRTGDQLVVIDGEVPAGAPDWGCSVVRRSAGQLTVVAGSPHLHEIVAGVRFRITGPAFFQVNTRGADELVALVSEAIRPGPHDVLLDAYAGGGLFSATVGRNAGRIVAVETGDLAVADLRHNLATAGVDNATVVDGRVEEVLADPIDEWDLAICDPPRTGLGANGVMGLVQPRPRAVVYVSCDPASFARDVRHFVEAGYRLERATPVDLFPQTFHVETVALLLDEDGAWGV